MKKTIIYKTMMIRGKHVAFPFETDIPEKEAKELADKELEREIAEAVQKLSIPEATASPEVVGDHNSPLETDFVATNQVPEAPPAAPADSPVEQTSSAEPPPGTPLAPPVIVEENQQRRRQRSPVVQIRRNKSPLQQQQLGRIQRPRISRRRRNRPVSHFPGALAPTPLMSLTFQSPPAFPAQLDNHLPLRKKDIYSIPLSDGSRIFICFTCRRPGHMHKHCPLSHPFQ